MLVPAGRLEASPHETRPSDAPSSLPSWCPQPYTVQRDGAAGTLTLATPYYAVQHDLKKGGAISRIHYTHGQAENLPPRPLAATVQVRGDEPAGEIRGRERRQRVYTDVADASPAVSTAKNGKWDVVTVTGKLLNHDGQDSGIVSTTTYTYRWGYIKIHRELRFPEGGLKLRRLTMFSTLLHPSLTHYGYNPHAEESFSSEILQNGSCFWAGFARERNSMCRSRRVTSRATSCGAIRASRALNGSSPTRWSSGIIRSLARRVRAPPPSTPTWSRPAWPFPSIR